MKKNDKLLHSFTQGVKHRLKLCLFNLVSDTTLETDDSGLPSHITELKSEVFKIFTELPSSLRSKDTDRDSLLSRLSELKNEVLKEGIPVYALMNYGFAAEGIINREHKIKNYKDMEEETSVPDDIIEAIKYFTADNINDDNESEFFRHLISSVPCTMSKGKFANYVTDSFKYSEDDINTFEYKMKILPFYIDEGRKAFPEQYEKLDKILNTPVNKISDEELTALAKNLPMNSADVFTYTDVISMMYSDINYMAALLLYCIDIDFITDGDLVLKDLFYSAAELAAKEHLDEIDIELKRQTSDKAEDIISELYEDTASTVKEFAKNERAYFKTADKDGKLESAFKAYKNTFNLYMAEAEEDICKIKTEEPVEKSPEALAAEFISEFEEATAAFPPAVKKSLRLEAIMNIPCPWSYDESTEYVRAVLNQYYGKPQYRVIASNINTALRIFDKDFLNKFMENMINYRPDGAEEAEDECNCGHDHHHHHDDGCNCGHDHHHHDEDCDCGHDHHHSFEKHL